MILALACPASDADSERSDDGPRNLAVEARVSASDEYNPGFSARYAVDGKVPGMLSRNDHRAAWVIRGQKQRFQG